MCRRIVSRTRKSLRHIAVPFPVCHDLGLLLMMILFILFYLVLGVGPILGKPISTKEIINYFVIICYYNNKLLLYECFIIDIQFATIRAAET